MKIFIMIMAILFANIGICDETIKIYYSGGPLGGIFIPNLGIDASGLLLPSNDGQDAINQALKDDNSFFVSNNISSFISKHFYKNYIDPYEKMEFVAVIGDTPFVISTSPKNGKSIEEILSTKKVLKLGGGNNFGSCFFAGKWLELKYNVKIDYIYYKNFEQGLVDAINQNIDLVCRYGSGIDRNESIVPIVKFTSASNGILQDVPIGIPVDNKIILYAKKGTKKELVDKLKHALLSQSYLDNMKHFEHMYINYKTNFDIFDMENELKIYQTYFNEVIEHNQFLKSRIVK